MESLLANCLPLSFYERPDVTLIARELLGKRLCTFIEGTLTVARIIETEAYCGRGDRACHANNGCRTTRTEVMYGPAGYTYIYLCYGIHHLLNVVTNREGLADAVLIRSIEPLYGSEMILQRRGASKMSPAVVNGPGKLTRSIGVSITHNGLPLDTSPIWISGNVTVSNRDIVSSKRIGVEYAGEDADRHWRYTIRDSTWLSRPPAM